MDEHLVENLLKMYETLSYWNIDIICLFHTKIRRNLLLCYHISCKPIIFILMIINQSYLITWYHNNQSFSFRSFVNSHIILYKPIRSNHINYANHFLWKNFYECMFIVNLINQRKIYWNLINIQEQNRRENELHISKHIAIIKRFTCILIKWITILRWYVIYKQQEFLSSSSLWGTGCLY